MLLSASLFPPLDADLDALRTRRLRRHFAAGFQVLLVLSMYGGVLAAWLHLWWIAGAWVVQARVLGLCAFYINDMNRRIAF